MDFFLDVLIMIGRVLMETFTSPLFILIFLGLFFIIVWQYKRLEIMSEKIVGIRKDAYLQSALVSSLLGLIGGTVGSILLVFIGIDLYSIGIGQLWIMALLLMLINPRFLCFAYAGGLLSIISFFTGYPQISIPQLMGLVAILHMAESILILINGRFNPVPIYVQKANTLSGGFNLQKFWPIPLVALISTGVAVPDTGLAMPDWWPILKDYTAFIENQNYALIPIVAILGYGEITTTSPPSERVKKSAFNLFIFSLVLLMLSILASKWAIFLVIAALFSPLGHELVIWLGLKDEAGKSPLYVTNAKGLMVLDVKPGATGEKMGIQSQDLLLEINGVPVRDSLAVQTKWLDRGNIVIRIERSGNILTFSHFMARDTELGIITVPDRHAQNYVLIGDDSIFSFVRRVWKKIKHFRH